MDISSFSATHRPLVQLYFFYFGIATLLPKVSNGYGGEEPILGGFAWAVISSVVFCRGVQR